MSIRQTRADYRESLITARKPSREAVAAFMTRDMKRSLLRRGLITYTQPKHWNWEYTGSGKSFGGQVTAFTASQARAEVKKALGIKKGRLPQGVTISLADSPESTGTA